jgi:hypothetical protein
MAFLLVDDAATALWETLNTPVSANDRPPYIEQTDGITNSKKNIGLQLIAVSETMKHSVDTSLFSTAHIGVEAAHAVRGINPSNATFSSPDELFTLHTKFVNQHDELLKRLDSSGQGAAENTIERRLKCFNHYIGSLGRSKNLGLFYCFIVWEGKSTRWLSKRLPDSLTISSGNQISNTSTVQTSNENALSKKEMKKIVTQAATFKALMSQQSPKKSDKNITEQFVNEKRRLIEETANAQMEAAKNSKVQKIGFVLSNQALTDMLTTEEKNQLKHELMNALLK